MRAVLSAVLVACAACADPPPPLLPPSTPIVAPPVEGESPPAPPPSSEPPVAESPTSSAAVDASAPAPPSTASFEQATSTPEPVGIGDDRAQLTDIQLNGPMRGAFAQCKVPPKAKVTIKTAVQNGRAIGVTVLVDLPAPKAPKKPTKSSKAAAKAHAKTVAQIVACADKAVRALSWPPTRRRDAFTTTL